MLRKHRNMFFRVGTGEITDSLALEPLTGMVGALMPYFVEQPNVLLELKTKSDCVDSLLDFDSKGRIVVAWSMNPQRVIDWDEADTASFRERLSAARRCQEAGYRLGFHFDPMIEYPGWEKDYQAMIEEVFATSIGSVCLGDLAAAQYAGLERAMRERFPHTQLLNRERCFARTASCAISAAARRDVSQMVGGFAAPRRPEDLSLHGIQEVWQQVFGYAPACEKELGNEMAPSAESACYDQQRQRIGVFDSASAA